MDNPAIMSIDKLLTQEYYGGMTRNSTHKLDGTLAGHYGYKLYCYETFADNDGETLYFRNVKADGTWGVKQITITYYDKTDEFGGVPAFTQISKEHTGNWNSRLDDCRNNNIAKEV